MRDLLSIRPEQLRGDLAVVAQLQVDRQGLLRKSAQGLAVRLDRGIDLLTALLGIARKTKTRLALLCGRGVRIPGLHLSTATGIRTSQIPKQQDKEL